jgi:ribosomal protein L4
MANYNSTRTVMATIIVQNRNGKTILVPKPYRNHNSKAPNRNGKLGTRTVMANYNST